MNIVFNQSYESVGNLAICVQQNKNVYAAQPFTHCRDRMRNRFKRHHKYILYVSQDREQLRTFFEIIENKLNLKSRTVFVACTRRHITWVEVPFFWRASSIRRSLFTALLRVARQYNPKTNNFKEALYSLNYTGSTKPAVERFLSGHTVFHGEDKGGWQATFTKFIQGHTSRGRYVPYQIVPTQGYSLKKK